MEENKIVKLPNFVCCVNNVKGGQLLCGVRMLIDVILIMGLAAMLFASKVKKSKNFNLSYESTFFFNFIAQDLHPSDPNYSPELVRTGTALVVQFSLSLIVDLMILFALKKAHLRLLCAGMMWILFTVLFLLVSAFHVEQKTPAVLLIMVSLGLQLWSLLVYFGAYHDLKNPSYADDLTFTME